VVKHWDIYHDYTPSPNLGEEVLQGIGQGKSDVLLSGQSLGYFSSTTHHFIICERNSSCGLDKVDKDKDKEER
jgi:hypothetical protein